MRKLRELSLYSKFILFATACFFVPFFICGIFWYKMSTDIIESNVIRYSQQTMEQINDRLDTYFLNLEKITLPVVSYPVVFDFLKMDDADMYRLIQTKQTIQSQVFPNMISGRSDILGFSIVSDKGMVVSTISEIHALEAYDLYARSTEGEPDNGINFRIQGIRSINSNPVLTVTRNLFDPLTYAREGMLVIDLSYPDLSTMLEKVKLGRSGFLWAVTTQGYVMYHQDERMRGSQMDAPDRLPLENGYYIDDSPDRKKLVIHHYSRQTGWILIAEVPLNELLGNLILLRNTTIALGILLIVLVFFGIGVFTLSLTRPLLRLQKLMKRAEMGDLNVAAPQQHRHNEIGALFASFNKMVSEIRRLVEVVHLSELKEKEMAIKQMESKLLITQSQINPHFLYNTLEIVNSYAIEAGIGSISRMVAAIAKMFRYNIGNPQKTVSLAEELQHIRTYLEVQKERYPGLETAVSIADDVAFKVITVRLILQPVVENAFSHGYEAYDLTPGHIEIVGESGEDGLFHLFVRDRGKGMPPETKQRYNTMFRDIPVEQMIRESHWLNDKSIGLWNVHSRLQLTFGEKYGLYILASDESGTELEIKLPLRDAHV